MKGCLKVVLNSVAMIRPTMSVAPPGTKDTTMLTGLEGQASAARAVPAPSSAAALVKIKANRVFMLFMVSP
ncbi:hypothetical protein D3C78_1836310 [compost metagenome]